MALATSAALAGMADAYPPYPLTPYPPLIINAALTGMVPQRPRVPHVPVTADEIVSDAIQCAQAGAAILHLHARAPDGRPEWRREGYAEFIPRIRERCPDVVICASTSGRAFPELERRADVLSLEGPAKPDMASLTLGSLNFRDGLSANPPAMIEGLLERMRGADIKPEFEIFDSGMAYYLFHLADQGAVEPPFYANLMLGSINTAPGRATALVHLVDSLPDETVWAAAGLGGLQLPMNATAVFIGGHVRTGLEDNPYLDYAERTPARNVDLVERIRALASIAGREIATPGMVRAALGLPLGARAT